MKSGKWRNRPRLIQYLVENHTSFPVTLECLGETLIQLYLQDVPKGNPAWNARRLDARRALNDHSSGLQSKLLQDLNKAIKCSPIYRFGIGLGLSARTTNCLASAGVLSINALTWYCPSALLRIKRFGVGCLAEVQTCLEDHGKHLAPNTGIDQRTLSHHQPQRPLDSRDRLILQWYHTDGQTMAEIAARIGVSRNRVSQLLRRAMGYGLDVATNPRAQ